MSFTNSGGYETDILRKKRNEADNEAVDRLTKEGWNVSDYSVEGDEIKPKKLADANRGNRIQEEVKPGGA